MSHAFTLAKKDLEQLFRLYTLSALEHEDDDSLNDPDEEMRLKDFLYWAGHRKNLPMAE